MKAAEWEDCFELESIGRSGRRYSLAVIAQAEIDAARGDAAAQVILDDIAASSELTAEDLARVMNEAIHDCPDCQAARARGEILPTITADQFRMPRSWPAPRPENWWHGKRPKKAKRRGRR